ncbi:MAG: ACT domain-containing protein [Bacteroidota bacterium]
MALRLSVVPGTLAVCRLAPEAPVEDWMGSGPLASITRTADELSVVCAEATVPQRVQAERGWRALRVEGPLEFSLTGVLASLAVPLAEAGISIFAISTFNTDWLLVQSVRLGEAVEALRDAGHEVSA